MSQHWTCAKCDQPILKGQPFTTAIVPGRSPKPRVVSGKVLVHKNERDCKKPETAIVFDNEFLTSALRRRGFLGRDRLKLHW